MNSIVSAAAGAVLALVAAFGGVAAYQGNPTAVSTGDLTTYADE